MEVLHVLVSSMVLTVLRIAEAGPFQSHFQLRESVPNTNGTMVAYWFRDDDDIWTPIFGGCFDNAEPPSKWYAGKACKENGYLGGWEKMIAVTDLDDKYHTNITTRVNCDIGDDSEKSNCVDYDPKCTVKYIGGVQCFNATRARRATCNSSIPVSYLEVYFGDQWVQVCRSNNNQNTASLCRTLGLEAQPIAENCHTNLAGYRFHGCASVGACDECTVKCSVPKHQTCRNPGIPEFGFRRYNSDIFTRVFPFGATVEYDCDPDYRRHGAQRLECVLQDAHGNCSWSDEMPVCIIKNSEEPVVHLRNNMMNYYCLIKDILLVVIAVTSLITVGSLAYIIFLGWRLSTRKDNKLKYSTLPKPRSNESSRT
ncbi:uncharacterized protein [Amphiura filiformis]|uniref:uncharacterized protein n=1 Tax=Amphiura filiformis TaxID=82378 RepID=UPI003B223D24